MDPERQKKVARMTQQIAEGAAGALKSFWAGRKDITNKKQLADELRLDATFVSRLLAGGKKLSLGLNRLLDMAAAMEMDPVVFFLTARTERAADLARKVEALCQAYSEEELTLVLDVLSALVSYSKACKSGPEGEFVPFVRDLLGAIRDKDEQAKGATREALLFDDQWYLWGLLTEAHLYKASGHFHGKDIADCLSQLAAREDGTFSCRLLAQYYALHHRGALVESESDVDEQRKMIDEYAAATGKHFTADRLRSKLLRRIGDFEKADAAARSGLRKIAALKRRRTYLDNLEEVKTHTDLVAAKRRHLRAVSFGSAARPRGGIGQIRQAALTALAKAKAALGGLAEFSSFADPDLDHRLIIEEALIRERPEGAKMHKGSIQPCVNLLMEARRRAWEARNSFGAIRANVELYRINMSRQDHAQALDALSQLAQLRLLTPLTPRVRMWLGETNDRYPIADADGLGTAITGLCRSLIKDDGTAEN